MRLTHDDRNSRERKERGFGSHLTCLLARLRASQKFDSSHPSPALPRGLAQAPNPQPSLLSCPSAGVSKSAGTPVGTAWLVLEWAEEIQTLWTTIEPPLLPGDLDQPLTLRAEATVSILPLWQCTVAYSVRRHIRARHAA